MSELRQKYRRLPVKMPVTGLPAAVETALTALLTVNSVSSWKITGEEGLNTVVVLRLKPVDGPVSTNMAEPVLNRSTQVQYFRKKAPCQLRRDQERARTRQQKERQAHSEYARQTDRVENTSQLSDTCIEQQCSKIRDTQHSTTPSAEQCEKGSEVPRECPTNLDLPSVADSNASVSLQPPDGDREPFIDNTIAGFDTGIVKRYIASLTDRSVQRHLRDRNRNKTFQKVTLHRSDDSDVLLYDSDDIVLEYTCDSNADDCTYWFVKQKEKLMLCEERLKLCSLRNGKHLPPTQHRETRVRAERDLEVLRGLIDFYLG